MAKRATKKNVEPMPIEIDGEVSPPPIEEKKEKLDDYNQHPKFNKFIKMGDEK